VQVKGGSQKKKKKKNTKNKKGLCVAKPKGEKGGGIFEQQLNNSVNLGGGKGVGKLQFTKRELL